MADGEDHVRKACENFLLNLSLFLPRCQSPRRAYSQATLKEAFSLGNTVWTEAFVLYIDILLAQRNLKRYTCYVWVKILLALRPEHHK